MTARSKDTEVGDIRLPSMECLVRSGVLERLGRAAVSSVRSILMSFWPQIIVEIGFLQHGDGTFVGSSVETFCDAILLRCVRSRSLVHDTLAGKVVSHSVSREFATIVRSEISNFLASLVLKLSDEVHKSFACFTLLPKEYLPTHA
jgi:hypothetical protein